MLRQPEFILFDNDIPAYASGENAKYKILNAPFYFDLSVRELIIKEFRDCAKDILSDYSPVEKGYLLTAYRRKK